MATNKRNDFIMQGSILAAAGIITRFIGLIYRAPLTRIIGSEGMAYYNTAYEIYNLVLLLSTYSLPVAVSKLVSSYESKKEYKNSYRVFQIALIVAFILGGIAAAVLFIFAKPLATAMGWPSAAIPLRVLAPTIFIFSIMGVIRGLFQGKRTMVPTAISQLIEQIFNAIVSVVAALLLINAFKDTTDVYAHGAAGGTAGTLFGAFTGLLFLLLIFFINRGYFAKQRAKDKVGITEDTMGFVKMVLLTMLPIILSQTVYQLSGIIDNTMFGRIMSDKGFDESGRAILWEAYSNRYKWLSNLPVAISTAFGVSIVPMLSASFAKGDIAESRRKAAAAIKINMLVAIPSAAGLAAIARPVINLIFGDTGETLSQDLMRLGAIAIVFFAYSTITNGILQGINRMRVPVIHAAISLGVHIVLVYLLLKVFDFSAYGLVIGNVTYALLVSVLNFRSIEKHLEYKQEFKKTFLIPLLSSAVMGVAAWGVYSLLYMLIKINAVAVVFAIAVAVIVYFASLILFKGVTRDELLGMPKGRMIVRAAEKLHLLKKEQTTAMKAANALKIDKEEAEKKTENKADKPEGQVESDDKD